MKKTLLLLSCLVTASVVTTTCSASAPLATGGGGGSGFTPTHLGLAALMLPFIRLYNKVSVENPTYDFVLSGRKAFTFKNIWKIIDQGLIGQRFAPKTVNVGHQVKLGIEKSFKPASGVLGTFDSKLLNPAIRAIEPVATILGFIRLAHAPIPGDFLSRRNPLG